MPGKTNLTEDYILRMISTAVAALARIVGLKTAGQYNEAQALIDHTLEELFGLRADLLKRLDDTNLIASLTVQDKPDAKRLTVAGRLFKEEGDINIIQRDLQAAFWSYVRALNLSLEAALNGAEDETSLNQTIAGLVKRLEGYGLPGDTSYALFCYYEEQGSYQLADSALKSLETTPDEEDAVLKERAAFYNRLLEKTDSDLSTGGFTRLQVVEALNTVFLHKSK